MTPRVKLGTLPQIPTLHTCQVCAQTSELALFAPLPPSVWESYLRVFGKSDSQFSSQRSHEVSGFEPGASAYTPWMIPWFLSQADGFVCLNEFYSHQKGKFSRLTFLYSTNTKKNLWGRKTIRCLLSRKSLPVPMAYNSVSLSPTQMKVGLSGDYDWMRRCPGSPPFLCLLSEDGSHMSLIPFLCILLDISCTLLLRM